MFKLLGAVLTVVSYTGLSVAYEAGIYLLNRTLSLSTPNGVRSGEGERGDGHPDTISNDEETPCN